MIEIKLKSSKTTMRITTTTTTTTITTTTYNRNVLPFQIFVFSFHIVHLNKNYSISLLLCAYSCACGFVLLGTRQQDVPVILKELVPPGGFDLVSSSFTVGEITTELSEPINCDYISVLQKVGRGLDS
ncbi:unnamed protein product [Schistosoma curassoni]|uniref:Uncharacterized protein n=1 Tax=Schistosoma curassoni TaxID=6186 RepID=A0A183KUG0_9TREM|nr:unnamed protein product [Schistosoma curassoni]